jgi:DNA adenine methylase
MKNVQRNRLTGGQLEVPSSGVVIRELSEPPLLTGERHPHKLSAMSPLRYPGSKRKMLPSIQQLIEGNVPKPELFVEPFCGGSSVSLGLLEIGAVSRVLLADLNPLVSAFWQEATTNAERLVDDMMKEPVTVERWDFWRQAKPRSTRRRALKCLFLNRTTFSGIIGGNAGPIGGRAQASAYDIGCRFEKHALAERILTVKALADEGKIVGVLQARWQEAIRHAEYLATGLKKDATIFYLDPPYIEKAGRLYELPFIDRDHRGLATYLTEETRHRWILSYDKEPLVLDFYRSKSGVSEFRVTHHYTMTGNRRKPVPGREILFTNLPRDPTDTLTTSEG